MEDAVAMFDNTLSYIKYPFVRMSVPELLERSLMMRSALVKLREGRGEGIISSTDETLELGKENKEEDRSCLLHLLDPLSNALKRGSCFEVPQPKRKRSLPLEEEFLEEEKVQRRDRCPSEESNNSIDAELNRHFRPIKRAPLSPPKVSILLS